MNTREERRNETRLLCADFVEVIWQDDGGRERRRVANLEDISPTGMRLQLETPLHAGTEIHLRHAKGSLNGVVRYVIYQNKAYFVGVEFDSDVLWSKRLFRPRHLLDPRDLLPDLPFFGTQKPRVMRVN